jgi:glutamate synthase (NADPH/NADH) large chain
MDNATKIQQYGLYDPRFEHDACGVGFVCHIKGQKSHAIVRQGLEVLCRLSHRGAVGADPKTGDGAGILIQTPHDFFKKAAREERIDLPAVGAYGTGLIFLPSDKEERSFCKEALERIARSHGQVFLGWRKVPTDHADIGKSARSTEPAFEQAFIAAGDSFRDPLAFERKLYVIRKETENEIRSSEIKQKKSFYITNLSGRTFSYKGLLMPDQMEKFFLDLKDPDL